MPVTSAQPEAATRSAAPAAEPAPTLAMYVAGLIVTWCGLQAVQLAIGTPDDGSFGLVVLVLTLIGFAVSYLSVYQNVPARTIELPAYIAFASVCVLTFLAGDQLPLLAPAGVADDRPRAMAVFLTWLVVLRSYTLTTNARLLFAAVPTMALIGLVGTMQTDPALITLFIVFACAATFMVVHEHAARTRAPLPAARRESARRGLLVGQLQLAAVCSIGAVVLGRLLAPPLHAMGSSFVLPGIPAPPARTSESRATTTVTAVAERNEVRVATGPVQLSDEIMMRVRAEHGAYWRGATFDEYTGTGWRSTLDPTLPLRSQRGSARAESYFEMEGPAGSLILNVPPTELTQVGTRSHRLRQLVRLESNRRFSEIYGAAELRSFRVSDIRGPLGGPRWASTDGAGRVHLSRPLYATEYEVDSDIAEWTPATLRATGTRYPDDIRALYLPLDRADASSIARIREAAMQATRGALNPYDRVVALKEWIAGRCKYNTGAPAAAPDEDVVESFLFTEKQGYCDSFATALAVTCRTLGIAARVASGFITGDLDPETQWYVVRERHKHQWTEVYFPGTGWVTFDATDGAEDISAQRAAGAAHRPRSLLAFLLGRGWLPPIALLAFVSMLAYVLKVEVWDRFARRVANGGAWALAPENAAIVASYEALCCLLARKGLGRAPAETPWEYESRLRDPLSQCRSAAEAVSALTTLVVAARYGRAVATTGDVSRAAAALEAARAALRHSPRLRPASGPRVAAGQA